MSESSSADVPRADLADLLSTRRLVASLKGEICPACGKLKGPRRTLCAACYRQLPTPLQRALYRGIDMGYDRAVLAALRALGVYTFHELASVELASVPVAEQTLTPAVLGGALDGNVCPKCAGVKNDGALLCPFCLNVLRANFVQVRHCKKLKGKEIEAEWQAFTARLTSAALGADPGDTAKAVFEAFRIMRSRKFHHAKPQGGL